MMKIRFKKKRLYINIILGLVWTILGISRLLEDKELGWLDYGYLVIGVLYTGHFLFDLTNQYLIIENGTIRKNVLYGFGKKLNLSEIHWIKNFSGDYTLKTETKELKINTTLIEEESLIELNEILRKLNLPSEKTPFTNNV